MDIEKELILIKGKDETEKVVSCEYKSGRWKIRFDNGSKEYTYSGDNVIRYSNPHKIDPQTHIVYKSNMPISNIRNILIFDSYIKFVFKSGRKKTYPTSAISIEQTSLSSKTAANCLDYLKELVNHIGEDERGKPSFLSNQYSGLSTVSPRSVLSTYLERKPLKRKEKQRHVIFPFGFNESQKSAAERAMTEHISIIEGPPGTGKTQTILNIIANAIVNKETVAVVSNNNSATANVLEKLQKYGLDFIAAYLGNKENKEKFFADQGAALPDMSGWMLEYSEYRSIEENLKASQQELTEMLEHKNKQALLKQELSELQTQQKHFDDYYSEGRFEKLQLDFFFRLSADRVGQLLTDYTDKAGKGDIKLSNKLYNLFIYGIYNFRFYRHPPKAVISFLQKTYYQSKAKELKSEIEKLAKKLKNSDFEVAMKEYSEDSMRLFKASLAKSYGQVRSREQFTTDAFSKNFKQFIKEYPVILSTTHSLRNSAAENYLFDYVLVDEASQVDVAAGALALSCAENAVIVGDRMQLPNVVPKEIREKATRVFEKFDLDQAYNYAEHSLLSSMKGLYEDIPKTLLREHYRCHPKIIGFCNQSFYNNELVVLTEDHGIDQPLLLYKTVKGNHARKGWNQRQIDVILKEILPGQNLKEENRSSGIVSPFRRQADELQKGSGTKEEMADTVHKYQGREKDTIILSTVSNKFNPGDFADNANLINVAVSRAAKQLIVVVGAGSENWNGTNVGNLVRYIKYHSFEVIESKIHSVFDLLYKDNSKKLSRMLKNHRQVSEHSSENLMNMVTEKVLGQDKFHHLDFILHYPLWMVVKDPSLLTDEEREYAFNSLTHMDFLIFNKSDKVPVLAVEVDGHRFHADNPTQLKRDEMKDKILQKYGIPVIRMKTTGSEEERVLSEKLTELLILKSEQTY